MATFDKNGKRTLTGEKLGNSFTTHSFVDKNEKVVEDAIIDMNSTKASDIVDDFKRNTPSTLNYLLNFKKYNFKGDNNSKQEKYEGSIMHNGEIGSMRDVGNYVAGYAFGKNGWPLRIARLGFERVEATENFTSMGNLFGNGTEGRSSVLAQNRGWLDGYKAQLSKRTGRNYD